MAGGLSSVDDDVITQSQRFHQNDNSQFDQQHNYNSSNANSNGERGGGCGINSLSLSTMPLPSLEDEPHHLENIWVLWFLQAS